MWDPDEPPRRPGLEVLREMADQILGVWDRPPVERVRAARAKSEAVIETPNEGDWCELCGWPRRGHGAFVDCAGQFKGTPGTRREPGED